MAYVLTARIKIALDQVISPAQTAYMPGRYIGTNIWKIQDVINFAHENQKEWVVLFLDFRKAFDSVSHIFLWNLLHKMNFPPSYILWIMLMYSCARSRICNVGWLLPTFFLG